MSIPSNSLKLRLLNTTLTQSTTNAILQVGYEIYHDTLNTVIDSGTVSQVINNYSKAEEADANLWSQIQGVYKAVLEWHKAQPFLNGYSYHDANLVLNQWVYAPQGSNWKLTHPISGEFENVLIATSKGRPTLLGRLQAVGSKVLLPPTWAWADSPTAEELRVWCVAVSGADKYKVYNGNTELGETSTHNQSTLALPAGTYQIRMAPVAENGTVGILGVSTTVTVEAVEAMAMSYSVPSATFTPVEKPTLKDRIKKALGR